MATDKPLANSKRNYTTVFCQDCHHGSTVFFHFSFSFSFMPVFSFSLHLHFSDILHFSFEAIFGLFDCFPSESEVKNCCIKSSLCSLQSPK